MGLVRFFLVLLCLAGLGCAGPARETLREQAIALNDSGYNYYREGQWEAAKGKFSQALTYNRLVDHRSGIAVNLNNLGAIYQEQGELQTALDYFREALTLYREQGNTAGVCETLNNLGTVYQAQGRLKDAEEAYAEALTLARGLPPGALLALSLTHLGDAARSRGDYGQALDLYRQALQLDEKRKDRRGLAVRWERLGRTYTELKDFPAAGKYLHDALREFRQLEATNGIADTLRGLTLLALARGDRQEALSYGERLLKIYQARGQDKEAKKLQTLLSK
jgi:tetratricopeptide (TPR) repeat protein